MFQTIVDIANNKKIQRVILGSELISKRSFDSGIRFSTLTFPVITEKFLKRAYTMGVILTKTFSKAKMQTIMQQHQVSNQEVQKEITAVIEKDAILNREITQLSNLQCDCENDKGINWSFPVICTLLFPLFVICFIIALFYDFIFWPAVIIDYIGLALNCFWAI
jgi:hypothetical protein